MATIKVTAPILKIGSEMSNGMIIPKGTVEHMVKEWNEAPWEKFGQISSDAAEDYPSMSLSRTTHKIKNLSIKDDFVVADMELISDKIIEYLNAGGKLYGTCIVTCNGNEPLSLHSVNITNTPSGALKPFPLQRVTD